MKVVAKEEKKGGEGLPLYTSAISKLGANMA